MYNNFSEAAYDKRSFVDLLKEWELRVNFKNHFMIKQAQILFPKQEKNNERRGIYGSC